MNRPQQHSFLRPVAVLAFALAAGRLSSSAEDWPQFRGVNGSGVSRDQGTPSTWSDTENVLWKADLPGPGSSSPITTGPYVLVTCFSGYGRDRAQPGEIDKLERHLFCFDRQSGNRLWKHTVPAKQPEDPFRGFIAEHGYASSTPVTDGERVYVFFGKSGVQALDLAGKPLWQAEVGSGSAVNGWGSAASLVLHRDLLIVNAQAESESIIGFDKRSGREVWRATAKGYKGTWSTPALLRAGDRDELIVTVPGEVWGLDPADGRLWWYCEAGSQNAIPSAVTREGVAYVISGDPGGPGAALAIRGGGRNDVTKTQVAWKKDTGSYVPSPVLLGDRLLWVNERGLFRGLSAKDGAEIATERLPDSGGVYASVVASGDKLYAVTRRKGTFVLKSGDKLEQVAHNVLASDDSDFNASPAIHGGQLFLRSNRRLYCIGKN
jgi:hypothetical protein